jgi:hypothetical protein
LKKQEAREPFQAAKTFGFCWIPFFFFLFEPSIRAARPALRYASQ